MVFLRENNFLRSETILFSQKYPDLYNIMA